MKNYWLTEHTLHIALLTIITCILIAAPISAIAASYEITIEHHRFHPDKLEIAADEKHRLIIINKDPTPEEFESYELNREKIVAANARIVIFLPPLDAGTYPFFGEFNPKTAQGQLIVK